MAVQRTGALWFGLGTLLTLLGVATVSIYFFRGADPMLGQGISFQISVWVAVAAWLIATFTFAAGAHRFKTVGSPFRSFMLAVLVAMSDEGKPTLPEHIFKRFVWRSVLGIGEALEQFTTWTITGVAAIVALFVSNLDSVSQIVSLAGIRWSLVLFALSILAGVVSKQIGMAVQSGVNLLAKTEALLNSEDGERLMDAMTIEPRQLVNELAAPFFWPLNRFILTGGERGLVDYVAGDKRMVRMFCIQLYLSYVHSALAVAALIVLGSAIGAR